MNDTFKLAMELTMIDMLSGVAQRVKQHILSMGDAGKSVARDFDLMQRHITNGLKGIAAANYAINKLTPGVAAAADMQEELHKVEMNLANSTDNAASLHKQLQAIKDTANYIGQNSPFSAQQIVGMQAQLLKSGIGIQEVTGQHGVTWNAAGLAALSNMDPSDVGSNLAKIGQTFGFTKEKQYSEIANWLEKAESSAGHDLGHIFYGLMRSGNAAHTLGISAKDLTTMLTMAAPLGEEAGTAVNRFLDRLAGGHREERKYLKYMGLDLFDAKSGKFKGITNTLDEVRTKFGAIANDQNKLILFEKIFGEEGKRFAEIVTQSKQSFQDFDSFVNSHKDITQKQEIWAQGFNASWIKLVTTIKSTGASLFDPLLKPLTKTNDLVNNITGQIGALAEEHKGFAKTVSYGVAGAGGAAGLYALYNLVMGGIYGGRALSGLRGLAGTGLGIMEGSELQKMTGVQSVFVTNFPPSTKIPIVAGLIPTSVMLAPALLAAIVGALSIAFGKGKTDSEIKDTSNARLQELRQQHMIFGGGPNSYQVQAIDRELARRGIKPDGSGSWGSAIPLLSGHIRNGEHYGMLSSHHPVGMSAYDRDERSLRELNNNIKLEINIDDKGRTFTRVDGTNTTVTTLKRGNFFGDTMTSH